MIQKLISEYIYIYIYFKKFVILYNKNIKPVFVLKRENYVFIRNIRKDLFRYFHLFCKSSIKNNDINMKID